MNSSPIPEVESSGESAAVEAGHQLVGLKKTLEEATNQVGSLQSLLATQQQLEQLLKQGRAHLQVMRERLEQAAAERDRLRTELNDRTTALKEQEALHQRVAAERADERNTFERLLQESASNQLAITAELDEQRQQIQALREAAMRAQSLAREIVRAHERE